MPNSPPLPTRRPRAIACATLLVLGVLGLLLLRGLWKGGLFQEGRFNDFRAYHEAARGVWARDLVPAYTDLERPCQYPPTFAFLVAPLGLLPYRGALLTWGLLNGWIFLAIFRHLGGGLGIPISPLAQVLGLALVVRLLDSDFANGNANLLVLGLVLLALTAAQRERALLGGFLLALAALAKVSPLIGVFWMLYRRRWRALGGLCLGLVVLGGVVPVVGLGPRGAREAWVAWSQGTWKSLVPGTERQERAAGQERAPEQERPQRSGDDRAGRGYEPGQSLRALVHRLLRDSDATAHDDLQRSIHLVDVSRGAADLVYAGLALAALALLLVGQWKKAPGVRLGWRGEEIAAIGAAMVLLAPLSRKAHFVALWPAAVLGFEAWRLADGKWRVIGSGLWALALVLVVGTSPDLVGRERATLLLAYCPMALAAISLLLLVSVPGFFPVVIRGALPPSDCGGGGPEPPPAPPAFEV